MDIKRMLQENPALFIEVNKTEVENLDIGRPVVTLKGLSKFGAEARGRLFITFSGYDDIPDEVFEIREIRDYCAKLYNRFPFMFYYINQDIGGHTHILLSLVDVAYQKLDKPHNQYIGMDAPPKLPVLAKVNNQWLSTLATNTRQHGAKVRDVKGGNDMAEGILKLFPENSRR